MFGKKKKVSGDPVVNALKAVSFFKAFEHDEEIMVKIANMCTPRKFAAGKTIIEEGDSGDELYVFLSGKIDILKKTLQNEKYTVISLSSDKGGVYVGELALIDDDSRSATVTAKTDCDCLVIKRKEFIKFGNDNPAIGLEITRSLASQLSAKLRKANSDVITLFSALVEEIASED
jgi:CRP/FNR family transcriptional regulator, cyclic AMP receptor protein